MTDKMYKEQLETAEAHFQAEKLNLEHLLHQAEREKATLLSSQTESLQELSTSRLQLQEAQREIANLKELATDGNDRLARLQSSRDQVVTEINQERTRCAQLIERNAAVESEVDRVREDCSRYSDRQVIMTKQINDVERALSIEKNRMKPLQIQLADAEQRQKLLEKQNETISAELDTRSEQLIAIQRQHGSETGAITSVNTSLKLQCQDWENRCSAYSEEIGQLKTKMLEALNQVQEERNVCIQTSSQYQSELDAEKRLSAMYKRSMNELKQNFDQIEETSEGLRCDYQRASDRVKDLEGRCSEQSESIMAANIQIKALQAEIHSSNTQQPVTEVVLPGNVSFQGLTIEDVYVRLMQCTKALADERTKSRKLELYLEQIQEEVNEQIPLLQEQRSDYENVLRVNNTLAIRVQECNHQRDRLERKLKEVTQRADSETRQRLQLLDLLKRHGAAIEDTPDDLQLTVAPIEEEDVSSWRKLVEQLEQELKSRDLQLARLETQLQPPRELIPVSFASQTTDLSHDDRLVNELRTQIEMLQSEKSASERQLQIDVDNARQQSRELSLKIASLEGSLSLVNQKLEWITAQANRFASESEKLRAHDAHNDAMLTALQEKASSLSSELTDANHRYTRAANQLQQVRAQLDLSRQSEERLSSQCGDLAALRQYNEQLLSTMQSVQQRLETEDLSSMQQIVAEKEKIYKEWLQSQKQAAADRRALQQNIKILEARLEELQGQVRVEKAATEGANQKLSGLITAAKTAELAHAELLEQLRATTNEKEILANQLNADQETSGRQLMIELAHAQAEAQSLREKVSTLTGESDDWKALYDQRSKALAESEEMLRAVRERSELDNGTLRHRVEELTQQCKQADQQYEEVMCQLQQKDSLTTNASKEIQAIVSDAQRRVDQAEQRVVLTQQVASTKEQEALDYMKRYESELTGHARAISTLNDLRENVTGLQKELDASRQSQSDMNSTLASVQEQSGRDIRQLNDQLVEAKEITNALTKQNDLLLAQLETGRRLSNGETQIEPTDEAEERTRQIISFLRSEKEIAEAEAEASSRQCVRLQTEIAQLKSNLNQARDEIVKLQEEQANAPMIIESKTAQETAVLSESNQMLRAQKTELLNRCKEVEDQLSAAQDIIAPIQSELAEIKAKAQSLEEEKLALQTDVERWKSRNQQLLSRYNQVDPELYRQAQQSLEDAKRDLEQLQSKLQPKDAQITDLQEKLSKANQGQINAENLRKSALFNIQQVNQLKRELQNRPDPQQLVAPLSEAQRCIKMLRGLCRRSMASLEKRNENISSLHAQIDSQRSEISTINKRVNDLQNLLAATEPVLEQSQERHAQDLSSNNDEAESTRRRMSDISVVAVESVPEPIESSMALESTAFPDEEGSVRKRPSSPEFDESEITTKKSRQNLESPTATTDPESKQILEQSIDKLSDDHPPPQPVRRLRRVRPATLDSSTTLGTDSVVPEPTTPTAPVDDDYMDADGGSSIHNRTTTTAATQDEDSDAESGEILPDETVPSTDTPPAEPQLEE